jgi:hypothetical protein
LNQALEMRADNLSKPGQRRRGGGAVKQRTAHLPLEPLDGVGQRRLRDPAMPCRECEILVPAKRQEISNVAHLHGFAPCKVTALQVPASDGEIQIVESQPRPEWRAIYSRTRE